MGELDWPAFELKPVGVPEEKNMGQRMNEIS